MSAIPWVGQTDERGCVFACLSMVTFVPYKQVVAELDRGDDRFRHGVSRSESDQYLEAHGYAVARRERYHRGVERADWPPAPFGDVHLCEVSVGQQSHAVVMTADGTVLDPWEPEPRRLSDYASVQSVAAVVRYRR